jgi:NADH-ubiquinone oxidoreductase chain 4
LILGWGYQPKQVQAGIYTSVASLPLLVGILFICNSLGSLCSFLLCGDGSLIGGLLYVCMVFAFWVGWFGGVAAATPPNQLQRCILTDYFKKL